MEKQYQSITDLVAAKTNTPVNTSTPSNSVRNWEDLTETLFSIILKTQKGA